MKKMKIEISNIKGVDKIISEILEKEKIDYKKIDNIEIDGIDTLNEDGDYVYGHIMDYLQ
jgi:hypothetical protein